MNPFNLPENFDLNQMMQNLYISGEYFVSLPQRESAFFEENYHNEVIDPDGQVRQLISEEERIHKLMNFQKEILDELNTFDNSKRKIMDIGCGPGWLLSALNENWEKFGIEISSYASKIAHQYGSITCCSIEDFKITNEIFDVIVLHHVIEHLVDPKFVIEKIHKMLKKEGIIILGTPNFDCAAARRYGNNFRLLHDKTHVSLFSSDSLHRFLRDYGFQIYKVEFPYFETNYFSKQNLLELLNDDVVSPPFYGSVMTFFAKKI